jgi:transcription termination/antitermination protein NusG
VAKQNSNPMLNVMLEEGITKPMIQSDNADLKWYVVRAVSGQEKKVKGYLEQEINRQTLHNFIPQVLIPMEKIVEQRNNKKRIREKTFFPGYIMIEADLTHGEALHTILSIPGVLGFLGSEGKEKGAANRQPVSLRLSEVNRMLGIVDQAEEAGERLDKPFMVGETVKVMDGPFNGFTGTVEEIFEERKKLNVMVKIFGRATPVEVNYAQVEKSS